MRPPIVAGMDSLLWDAIPPWRDWDPLSPCPFDMPLLADQGDEEGRAAQEESFPGARFPFWSIHQMRFILRSLTLVLLLELHAMLEIPLLLP